jgi:PAS domain-containing protein
MVVASVRSNVPKLLSPRCSKLVGVVGSARHYPLELILLRQFAACLTTPVALFDMDRRLIYLNPAAEAVFGVDFADLGELSLKEALAIAQPKDVHGARLTPDTVPVGIALGQGRPEAGTVSIRDPRGRLHRLGTTTIPVRGYGGAFFGAMSIFWKLEEVGRVASGGLDPAPSRESGPPDFRSRGAIRVAESAKEHRPSGRQILGGGEAAPVGA